MFKVISYLREGKEKPDDMNNRVIHVDVDAIRENDTPRVRRKYEKKIAPRRQPSFHNSIFTQIYVLSIWLLCVK